MQDSSSACIFAKIKNERTDQSSMKPHIIYTGDLKNIHILNLFYHIFEINKKKL